MIKMVKELEKLIVNYEKLKRDLTGHDLNSLELISELEGLFNNIDIKREKWNLSDEVASNNIFNVLIATRSLVNTLVSLKNTYANNIEIDVNFKKSKGKEEPKEIEEFKINLLTRNEPDLISSLSPSISMMIYDGLRAVKQNAQFMQDIYLDYYRKHRDEDRK